MYNKMKWKSFALIGVVCSFAFGAVIFAAGGVERIQAYLNHDIKFTVNNKAWTPKDSNGAVLAPVILSGTSYLPTRAVAEGIGAQIEWNNATKTIAIASANGTREASERDQMIIKK